jgi:hypothetical protein
MADDLVQQKEGAAPAAPQTDTTLPDEVVQVPAVQALLAGSPPAVSTPVKTEDPSVKVIWENRDALQQAGISFYKSLAGDTGVIFNMLRIPPDVISEADKAGKLLEIAPPISSIDPAGNPLQGDIEVPNAFPTPPPASPPAPSAPVGSAQPKAPANVLGKLQGTRQGLIKPGGPTSGSRPGAGRVLNALTKPVV